MVRALCCLHNYLVDVNNDCPILYPTSSDTFSVVCNGGNPIYNTNIADDTMHHNRSSLRQSLDGGEHFDDVPYDISYNHQRVMFRCFQLNPREYLLEKLETQGISNIPSPMGSTTTNN